MKDLLDTFVFKENKIYLKDLHIERVFETYKLGFSNVQLTVLCNIYSHLECELAESIGSDEMISLTFSGTNLYGYSFIKKKITSLNSTIVLKVLETKLPDHSNYKWADRSFWNDIRFKQDDADDILIVNRKNQLVADTSKFNIFIRQPGKDLLVTPKLGSGCLNGVLRRSLIASGKAVETDLYLSDLVNKSILVGNSVRDLIPAKIKL